MCQRSSTRRQFLLTDVAQNTKNVFAQFNNTRLLLHFRFSRGGENYFRAPLEPRRKSVIVRRTTRGTGSDGSGGSADNNVHNAARRPLLFAARRPACPPGRSISQPAARSSTARRTTFAPPDRTFDLPANYDRRRLHIDGTDKVDRGEVVGGAGRHGSIVLYALKTIPPVAF